VTDAGISGPERRGYVVTHTNCATTTQETALNRN